MARTALAVESTVFHARVVTVALRDPLGPLVLTEVFFKLAADAVAAI